MQYSSGSFRKKKKKEIERIQIGKEQITLHSGELKDSTKKLLTLIGELDKVAEYKINTQIQQL